MRILSFDLSLTNSGWAVGDIIDGKLTIVEYGAIGTKRFATRGTGMRLNHIATEVTALYEKYLPDQVVKERSFSNGRITATQQIYKVVGIWEMVSHLADQDSFAELTPSTVKKAVTGNGRATKQQVAAAVKEITGIDTKVDDESDAIAVLIAYVQQEGLIKC